jgi:hypothetical protein
MSNLLEKLKTPPVKPARVQCKITQLLLSLNEDERNALEAVLSPDSGWTDTAISAVLQEEGHTVGETSIGRHRAGKHQGCRI